MPSSQNAAVVAEATCLLLEHGSVSSSDLPAIIEAFTALVAGMPPTAFQGSATMETMLPVVTSVLRDFGSQVASPAVPVRPRGRRPRAWKVVAPTNVPATPIEKLEAALKRSPIRLDDRSAVAVARASGKPVGKDKLERAQQIDDRLALTFGFDFGTAKFTAEFDVRDNLGSEAVAALMQMLDARR